MEKRIIIDGDEYKLIETEDGSASLLRYNPKTKMWVQLIFAREQHPEVAEYVTRILGRTFIQELVKGAAVNL